MKLLSTGLVCTFPKKQRVNGITAIDVCFELAPLQQEQPFVSIGCNNGNTAIIFDDGVVGYIGCCCSWCCRSKSCCNWLLPSLQWLVMHSSIGLSSLSDLLVPKDDQKDVQRQFVSLVSPGWIVIYLSLRLLGNIPVYFSQKVQFRMKKGLNWNSRFFRFFCTFQ